MLRAALVPFIDLSYLIFPNQCCLCGMILQENEHCICLMCTMSLPRTGFFKHSDNPAAMTFWGRVNFRHVMASFYYRKANPVQRMIHRLKYHGDKEAGIYLGQLLGSELARVDPSPAVNLLVPVPLHPKKEKLRGYNQSQLICQGISEITGWAIEPNMLIRSGQRESQTRKTRFNRWENAQGVFQMKNFSVMPEKHIWIIDDVITTGATLESCALAMGIDETVHVSAAAVAFSGRS